MNQVQIVESLELASGVEISMTPVIVTPTGKKAAEKIASVMQTAHAATSRALINEKGALGKQAREREGANGLIGLAACISNANYTPIAEWLALKLTRTVIIRKRSDYLYLPTLIEGIIADIEAKGTESAAKQADKMRGVYNELCEIMANADEIFKRKVAEREARKLANEAGVETPALSNTEGPTDAPEAVS